MRYSVLIDNLQNLTNSKVDISEIAKVIGKPARTLYTRGQRDTEFKQSEIKQIENFYNVDLSKIDTNKDEHFTLDYYPNVFGSCGTGYFVSSEEKERQELIAECNKPLSEQFTYKSACVIIQRLANMDKSLLNKGLAKRLLEAFNIDVKEII